MLKRFLGTAVVLLLLFPITANSGSTDVQKSGAIILFAAADGVHGMELWASDGSFGGTVMIKDINPGPSGSGPGEMVILNGRYHFQRLLK